MNKWTDKIEQTTQQFDKSFGSLSSDQLNWKPDENIWSIAQNIDHIIRLNRSYFPAFESLKQGGNRLPFIAKFSFITTILGNAIKSYTRADRKKKTKTFGIWEPGEGNFTKGILDEFRTHQSELKRQVEELQPFINDSIVISSPANRYLVYTIKDALDIITEHEERHYNQAKEVLASL